MGPGLRGAPGDEEFTRSSSRVVPRTSYYSNHPSSLGPSGPAGLGPSCASQTPRTCSHLALLTHSPPQPVAGPAWQQDTWPSSGSGPKAADLDLLPDKDTTARSPLSESEPSLLYITNQLLRTLTFFNNASLGWVFFRASCGFWPQNALSRERALRCFPGQDSVPLSKSAVFLTAAKSRRLPVRRNYGQLTWRTPPRSGSERK